MTKSLKDYQREAHALAKEKGFYDNVPDPFDHVWIGARLALIHAELSEALEELHEWGFTVCDTTGEKPSGFGVELADVLLRVFDLAESLNLNLDELVELKHSYNKSRAYKHGKKL